MKFKLNISHIKLLVRTSPFSYILKMSLNEAIVLKIIENKLQHENFRLQNYAYKPLDANGMMGEYFTLICTITKQNQSIQSSQNEEEYVFFVKKRTQRVDVLTKDITDMVYNKEIASFRMLQTINLPLLNNSCSNCFYYDDQHIVLEDLVVQGYINPTPYRVATKEELHVVLKTIGGMHAASIAYEEQQTGKNSNLQPFRLSDEFPEVFVDIYMNPDIDKSANYLNAVIRGIHTAINIFNIPEVLNNGKSLKNEINRFWDLLDPKIGIKPSKKYRNVMCHSDLWPANIFIRYNGDGKPEDAKLIDFQIMYYKPPAFDVLMYIFLNTTREYRQSNLLELKRLYYVQFSKYLEEYGINPLEIYTFDEFLNSFKEIEMYCIYLELKAIPIVYNSERSTSDVANSERFKAILDEDRSPLFTEFTTNENFMSRVKDILLDMVEYFENN